MRFATSTSILLLCSAVGFAAADKRLPVEQSSNELVEIQATLILDKEQIRQEVGSDLGGNIVLVRVRVRPLGDQPYKIDRDNFMLLDSNDGQHSTPFAPTQIAGNSSLIVTGQGTHGGMGSGPSFGIPGLYGGMSGGSSGSRGPDQVKITKQDSSDKTQSPLLETLKQKVLPEQETSEPISGLLYFPMEGKMKAKNLELYYKTSSGKLGLRFRT